MSGTPEINVLRKVGAAVTGFAKRNLGGEINPSSLDVSDRRSTKSRSISRRGFVQGTIGLVAGAVVANFLPRQGFAQTEDDAAADGPQVDVGTPPGSTDPQPPPGDPPADGSVEPTVPITDLQAAPVKEAPGENLGVPFVENYPGQNPAIEKKVSSNWQEYMRRSHDIGGQVDERAIKLNAYLNNEYPSLKRIGNNGETNIGLIALDPNDSSTWPSFLGKGHNFTVMKLIELKKTPDGQETNSFFLKIRVVGTPSELQNQPENAVGSIVENIVFPSYYTEIVPDVVRGLLTGKRRGMNGKSENVTVVADPRQLLEIIRDGNSEINRDITTWAWFSTFSLLDREAEDRPEVFLVGKLGGFIEQFRFIKANAGENKTELESSFKKFLGEIGYLS